MYIYICVCVCVCVWYWFDVILLYIYKSFIIHLFILQAKTFNILYFHRVILFLRIIKIFNGILLYKRARKHFLYLHEAIR